MARQRKLASDIGDRLVDLRAAMGWTQQDLGSEVGRGVGTVSEWERGVRLPTRRALDLMLARHRWPVEMFEAGGPMPSTVVNRALTARSVSEPQPPKPKLAGAAARFYRAIIRDLTASFGQGEMVSVEEAASYVQGLWNYATAECPELEQDVEPAGG
jgi:transcriptional regulator with XRE-family HTH domain